MEKRTDLGLVPFSIFAIILALVLAVVTLPHEPGVEAAWSGRSVGGEFGAAEVSAAGGGDGVGTGGAGLPFGQVAGTLASGPPVTGTSTLVVTPTTVFVYGDGAATAVVTLRDAYGDPVPGKEVALLTGGTAVSVTLPLTLTDGGGQSASAPRT